MTELIPIPSVLLDRLTLLGVDVPRLLRHAGIAPARFQVPKARFTPHELFAFWRSMADVAGAADIALRIGSEALPHQYDVASLAALHAPTLGEALKKFARYKRLVCGERVDVAVAFRGVGAGGRAAQREARIGFHWVHIEEALPMMLVDVTFASLLALARRGTGLATMTPLRLELARRRQHETMLRNHFGCEIHFDAAADVMVFEASALDAPFATHNADLLAVLVPGLEAQLREATAPSIADDVKAVLGRRMSGERPSVDKIAGELRMSPRTLQRRLEAAGTTYQSLLDDVRRDTSRRLLSTTDLDAVEVAFLLGFEEVNSFTRAFHAWEGVTPNRFREARFGRGGAGEGRGADTPSTRG